MIGGKSELGSQINSFQLFMTLMPTFFLVGGWIYIMLTTLLIKFGLKN